MKYAKGCPFYEMVRYERQAVIVYEDDDILAIMDLSRHAWPYLSTPKTAH